MELAQRYCQDLNLMVLMHLRIPVWIPLTMLVLLHTGCQPEGGPQKAPSTPTQAPPMSDMSAPEPPHPDTETQKRPKAEVTVGGKTWQIDPTRTYRATGVWINPNPRPRTEAEQARLATLQAEIDKLSEQLDKLHEEASYLERIEKKRLRARYHFGTPPHRAEGDIIDLGEFEMEMNDFTPDTEKDK